MSLTKRLKHIRLLRGLTQKDVADFMGVTDASYQQYELGRVKPGYDLIIKFCKILNVSADYLLGLSDEYEIKSPPACSNQQMEQKTRKKPSMKSIPICNEELNSLCMLEENKITKNSKK